MACSLGAAWPQSLITQLNSHGDEYRRKQDQLSRLALVHRFPRSITARARDFLREQDRMESTSILRFEPINQLSPALRGELMEYLHRGWLEKVGWVAGSPKGLVSALLASLSSAVYAPEELIAGSDLHVLQHGVVIKGMRVMLSGAVWGTDCILASRRLTNRFPARTLTHVDVCFLPQAALVTLLRAYPGEERRFRTTAGWYALRNWMLWYVRQTKLAAHRFQALLDVEHTAGGVPLVERFREACLAWRRRREGGPAVVPPPTDGGGGGSGGSGGGGLDKAAALLLDSDDDASLAMPRAAMEACLAAAGFNADGRIEEDILELLFARFDADGDGVVSVAEFLGFVEEFSAGPGRCADQLTPGLLEHRGNLTGKPPALQVDLVSAMSSSDAEGRAEAALLRTRKTSTRTTAMLQIQELSLAFSAPGGASASSPGRTPGSGASSPARPTLGTPMSQGERLRCAETAGDVNASSLSPSASGACPPAGTRGATTTELGGSDVAISAAVMAASARTSAAGGGKRLARRNELVCAALAAHVAKRSTAE